MFKYHSMAPDRCMLQWRIQGAQEVIHPPTMDKILFTLSIPITEIIWWMKLTKNAWIGTLIAKKLLLLEDFSPDPYQFSVFRKITILLISFIKHQFYVNVSMLTNEFSCLFKMFAQNMHQKGLYQTTIYLQRRHSIQLCRLDRVGSSGAFAHCCSSSAKPHCLMAVTGSRCCETEASSVGTKMESVVIGNRSSRL